MKPHLFIFIIFLFIAACTDVLIPDIGSETANHLTPADGSILRSGDVEFRWELIDFADSTRFILVSPDFIDPLFTCADTFLTSDRITLQLPSDQYEWKTIGYNDAFTSEQVVSSFEVITDQSLWLGDAPITLLIPMADFRTNADSVFFEFDALTGVEIYELTIKNEAGETIKSLKSTSTMIGCEIMNSGRYTWTVQGFNNMTNTSSKVSDVRNFEIDRVGPSIPTLIVPMMGDTISIKSMGPHIEWDAGDATSSAISLQIHGGSMDTIFQRDITNDQIALPGNLIDIFSSSSVDLNLSLYIKDDLGNSSDTLKAVVVLKK